MIDAGRHHPLDIILLASEGKNLLTWDRDCLVCLSTDCLKFLHVICFMQWQILFHLVLSSSLGLRLCYISLVSSSSLGYLNSRIAWKIIQYELSWELQGSSLLFLLENLCSAYGLSHSMSCSLRRWNVLLFMSWYKIIGAASVLLSWWSDWMTFYVDPLLVFFCSGIWGVHLRSCHKEKTHDSKFEEFSLIDLLFVESKNFLWDQLWTVQFQDLGYTAMM